MPLICLFMCPNIVILRIYRANGTIIGQITPYLGLVSASIRAPPIAKRYFSLEKGVSPLH